MTKQIAKQMAQTKRPLNVQAGGGVVSLVPQTTDEFIRLAGMLHASGMVPKHFDKPEKVLMAMMMGADLGFTPTQALSSITVINGKPSVYGDGLTAIARRAGNHMREWSTGKIEDGDYVAHCEITRADNGEVITREFSIDDAIRAGLWQTKAVVTRYKKGGQGSYETANDSPWYKYPKRMLMWRARSWAVRDGLSDQMWGLSVAEEVQDHQSTIDAQEQDSLKPSRLQEKLENMKSASNGPDDIEEEIEDAEIVDDEQPIDDVHEEDEAYAGDPSNGFDDSMKQFVDRFGGPDQEVESLYYNGITFFFYRNPQNVTDDKIPALNDQGETVTFTQAFIDKLAPPLSRPVDEGKESEPFKTTDSTDSPPDPDGVQHPAPKSGGAVSKGGVKITSEMTDWIDYLEDQKIDLASKKAVWDDEQETEWFTALNKKQSAWVVKATKKALRDFNGKH